MAGSDAGDSPDVSDLRRGSIASNLDVFESPPSTPTPEDPQGDAKDNQDEEKDQEQLSVKPPTASTSSLNLPLHDPTPTLDLPSATNDELLAALRTQITDLASQVTSLNSKLVKSYTTRGELEDDLHDKQEQEQLLRRRVAELEKDKQRWEAEIEAGGWVEKNHVQGEMQRLMTKVVEEAKSRESAVQAHSALETEIENLTSNLFSEANKMVASERLSRARAEEKTRSVEEAGVAMQSLLEDVQVGLKDTITKLEKRDAEVAELKKRLAAHGEHVEEDPEDTLESVDGDIGGIMFSDGEHLTPDTRALSKSTSSAHAPASLQLSAPRLLTTVLPYHEFLNFITYLRQLRVTALSRPPDGVGYPHPLIGGARGLTDASAAQTLSPAQLLAPHLLLSTHLSQPFLKRCVEEDSDPALRLDIAPGLGFLSRRTVGNAIVDGSLLIEPLHAGSELPSDKCALCGCSLEMWLPNSGHIGGPRANANKPAAAVNQTMRKMFGSSVFSRSNSSPGPSSSAPSSAYHSAASSVESFSFPPPLEKASHHPHDASLLVHLFRASDTASQRYAVCPSYCLSRLRAVCEFWTYVRVIERGLLLEEGFKFVQGRGAVEGAAGAGGSSTVTPALSRQASFARGGSAPPVGGAASGGAATPATEKAVDGLGLGPVGSEHSDVEAKDFEAEDTEDGGKKSAESGDEAATPKLPDSEGGDLSGAPASTDVARSASAGSSASSSAGSASTKPARPARSAARNTPVLGSTASPPASPSAPSLPPRQPQPAPSKPAPPPRHPSTSGLGTPGAPASSTLEGGTIVGNAIGWEDRCWSEVVRLKESVFWARVAAVAPDGAEVGSRGARVWVQ
ncbi:hypothetical protein JCM8547_001748 [Rhodosporidiobolus lusitaniae]